MNQSLSVRCFILVVLGFNIPAFNFRHSGISVFKAGSHIVVPVVRVIPKNARTTAMIIWEHFWDDPGRMHCYFPVFSALPVPKWRQQQSSTRLYLWRQFNAMNAFIISSHVITRTSLHAWIAGGQSVDNLISNPAQNGKDKQITGHEVCSSVSSRHFLTSLAPKTCCRTQLTTALFQTTGRTIWEPASVWGSRSSESFPKFFRNDSDDLDNRDDYMRTSL